MIVYVLSNGDHAENHVLAVTTDLGVARKWSAADAYNHAQALHLDAPIEYDQEPSWLKLSDLKDGA